MTGCEAEEIQEVLWVAMADIPHADSFTEQQTKRGRKQFGRNCYSWHMSDLSGNAGQPALVGDVFAIPWGEGTICQLCNRIHTMIP